VEHAGSDRAWLGDIALDPVHDPRLPPVQPPAARAFTLTDRDDRALGRCLRTDGIFRERPRPLVQPVTLLGCRPEPLLQALLERPSARRLRAMVCAVDGSGRTAETGRRLLATVTGSRPSRLGIGLLDVTLDDGFDEPLPSGARAIWQLWHTGRPARPTPKGRIPLWPS
jgi:hypothetical protein